VAAAEQGNLAEAAAGVACPARRLAIRSASSQKRAPCGSSLLLRLPPSPCSSESRHVQPMDIRARRDHVS
jgi:hypothetical protein